MAAAVFDQDMLTQVDQDALSGTQSWLATVAWQAIAGGPAGQVEDNLAYVAPWGFDPARMSSPILLLHGAQDRVVPRSHGEWLARCCRGADLRSYPDAGHVSILDSAADALDWILKCAE